MRTCKASLESVTQYSQGKYVDPIEFPVLESESKDEHEWRTWREKAHYDKDTHEVFIPGMQFRECIKSAPSLITKQKVGKGKETWSKHFVSGVIVLDDYPIGVKKENLDYEPCFIGKKGMGRVKKYFPIFKKWNIEVEFLIIDETITNTIFEEYLKIAGNQVGIGRYRPFTGEKGGGHYGRFKVNKVKWSNGK